MCNVAQIHKSLIVHFLSLNIMECSHIRTTLTLTENDFVITVRWTYPAPASTEFTVLEEPTVLHLTLLHDCICHYFWTIQLKQDRNLWQTKLQNVAAGFWIMEVKILSPVQELMSLSTTVPSRVRLLVVSQEILTCIVEYFGTSGRRTYSGFPC